MSNTKIWAISIVCLICGGILYVAAPSLGPVLFALFLAYIIHPLVLRIQKFLNFRRKLLAIFITLLLILTLLAILIISLLPTIVNQATVFIAEFNTYSLLFFAQVDQLVDSLDGMGLDSRVAEQLDGILRQLFTMLNNFIMGLAAGVFGIIFGFVDVIIVLLLLIFFLLDGPRLAKYVVNHMPATLKEAAENFLKGISKIVWGYLKVMVVISTCFGVAFGIILFILGVPFAGVLGVLGGVLNMIPYFGSIMSGAVALLVALLYLDVNRAILTLVLIIALNIVQGNIITPLVQANKLGMHPIVVISALMAGNYLWGIGGMFIAVPLLGLAHLLFGQVMIVIRKL